VGRGRSLTQGTKPFRYGEDNNVSAMFRQAPADLPEGYLYDFASSDVVLNRLAVADGRLTTTMGMSYRLLVLDENAQRMPCAVLRRIRDRVIAAATVVGPKPTESPSLMDDQAEYKRIADEL